jgi:transmembrane sensor
MLDDQIDSFRQDMQPQWDDLRARRGLRGALSRLEARRTRVRVRRRMLAFGVPGVTALLLLVVAYSAGRELGIRRANPQESAKIEQVAARQNAEEAAASTTSSSRSLSDGSRLQLSQSAHVELQTETPSRVELAQSDGRVRYEVAQVPSRAFVVKVRGAEVRVKGTVFVVDVGADRVRVSVERGRVQVNGPAGDVLLGAGEELVLAPDASPAPDEAVPPSSSGKSVVGGPRPAPRPEPPAGVTASALWERADRERGAGDAAAAAATLREFVNRYPSEPRIALAWFTLGKVERARGQAGFAAKAFHTSSSVAPSGPLAEDALAEEAAAWAEISDTISARAAAERYLRRFPGGAHAGRMRRILE